MASSVIYYYSTHARQNEIYLFFTSSDVKVLQIRPMAFISELENIPYPEITNIIKILYFW